MNDVSLGTRFVSHIQYLIRVARILQYNSQRCWYYIFNIFERERTIYSNDFVFSSLCVTFPCVESWKKNGGARSANSRSKNYLQRRSVNQRGVQLRITWRGWFNVYIDFLRTNALTGNRERLVSEEECGYRVLPTQIPRLSSSLSDNKPVDYSSASIPSLARLSVRFGLLHFIEAPWLLNFLPFSNNIFVPWVSLKKPSPSQDLERAQPLSYVYVYI